jgi:hypothetical protein
VLGGLQLEAEFAGRVAGVGEFGLQVLEDVADLGAGELGDADAGRFDRRVEFPRDALGRRAQAVDVGAGLPDFGLDFVGGQSEGQAGAPALRSDGAGEEVRGLTSRQVEG